eukprot:CAMPEP_0198136552 /NCGR_PEP_ID=MMETSP1443-20131203/194_1 /TAXON_ID=186043 /ORGANISM="Entomoneis sp., Strain CCMP2396" /LENGTH=285 /DNA_ID=CAMNT_0043797793 /DNA_START=57 /DNA_END=911 /DNA_ORIENTATION=+
MQPHRATRLNKLHLFRLGFFLVAGRITGAVRTNSVTTTSTQAKASGKTAVDVDGNMIKLGPIRLWNKAPPAFIWQAALDSTTGRASAMESSEIPVPAPLYQAVGNTENPNLLLLSEQIFTSYTPWLCSGRVSFGLLKAVPIENGGIEIRERLFGINLLRFGKPKGNQFSFTTTENKRHGANDSGIIKSQTTQCSWSLPITGGFLSAVADPKGAGKVLLMLKKTTINNPNKKKMGNDLSEPAYRCTLQTELVDYRPTIVGVSTPTNPIRVGLYLGTQSGIHALVMW